jgi:hypothetical protein
MDIINEISNNLIIEKDRSKISPIDNIKIMNDMINVNSVIIKTIKANITKQSYQEPEIQYLLKNIIDDKYKIFMYLMNNHYVNLFLDIYFVIGNVYLFTEEMFEIIYQNRKHINDIPNIIIKCWDKILSTDLKKFYNNDLINRWLKTLEFKLISKDKFLSIHSDLNLYKKYLEIFDIFDKNICILKRYVYNLEKVIIWSHNPGCININDRLYLYFVKIHTGLNITSYHQLKKLFKWAQNELTKLEEEQKNLIIKVRPDLKDKSLLKMIKTLESDDRYKYKTSDEFVNEHKKIIDNMHEYFIEKHQIKEFKKPKLTTIDDQNLAGAYWAFDTFYLNVANWNKVNKYEALALTLHEAVPGHHTQINFSVYDESKEINILYHLFGMTNGFSEGWALFTEKLAENYTDLERIGQLQYEILRTLRIIVDISIHGVGIPPTEIIKFMKKHLAMPDKTIESEVYRYVTIPGQALCYKIGCEIFRKIYKKYGGLNFNDEKSFDLYKKIIYDKEKSLEFLLKDYNMTFDDIFG